MAKEFDPQEKPRMFNKGVVFASVLKKPVRKQTDGGSVYASIQLQCPNALHGDVRVWGKLWGDQVSEALLHMSAGDKIRLEGVVQQYDGKHGRVTNFSFWAYRDCLENEIEDLRAVYIVVGDVVAIDSLAAKEEIPEMICLTIRYQSGKEGESQYDPERYQFLLDATDSIAQMLTEDLIGKRVKVSGVLRQIKDYFEDEIAIVAALKQIKVLWPKADGDIPF